MRYLALWLEGPLQSWGFDSKFDVRETFRFPTKSGIFGLLLAASGDSGAQEELLERMQCAPMVAYAYISGHQVALLRDFHMIGNGYDENEKWQNLHTTRTSEGKKPVGGGAKLTYRYYLQDKAFGVVLGFDDDLADKFNRALAEPIFDLYLGRKCCIPSDFIGRGWYGSEEEAQLALNKLAREKELIPSQQAREVNDMDEETWVLDDVPLRFGTHKIYKERLVRIEPFLDKQTSIEE